MVHQQKRHPNGWLFCFCWWTIKNAVFDRSFGLSRRLHNQVRVSLCSHKRAARRLLRERIAQRWRTRSVLLAHKEHNRTGPKIDKLTCQAQSVEILTLASKSLMVHQNKKTNICSSFYLFKPQAWYGITLQRVWNPDFVGYGINRQVAFVFSCALIPYRL